MTKREKRTNRLTILLRAGERERIREAARSLYLSESDFARMTLLTRVEELAAHGGESRQPEMKGD